MHVGTIKEIWRYPVKSMQGERLSQCRIETTYGIPGDRGWATWDIPKGQIKNAKRMPELLQCSAHSLEEPAGAETPPVQVQFPNGESIRTDDEPEASKKLAEHLGYPLRFVSRRPADDLEHYRRTDRVEALEETVRIECGLLPDEPLPAFNDVPPELFQYVSPLGTYFDGFEIHALTTASLEECSRLAPESQIDRRRFRPNLLIESPKGSTGFLEENWNGKELQIGGVRLRAVRGMMRCAMVTWEQEDLPKDPQIMRTLVREANHNLGSAMSVLTAGGICVGDHVELVE
jgi:uncharacterized protein YcbX